MISSSYWVYVNITYKISICKYSNNRIKEKFLYSFAESEKKLQQYSLVNEVLFEYLQD